MILDPDAKAAALLRELGPPDAWQTANREAIDAHLQGRADDREYWRGVQTVLFRTASRPGPGDPDVYRSVRLLMAEHGPEEALRMVMQRATAEDGDLLRQSLSLRTADAIRALSPGGPEENRTEF